MNLLRIRDLCEKKGVSIRGLAESIGMSEGNFHRCIRINQIQAHLLEQVAHELEVPIVSFFDEEAICKGNKIGRVSGNGNKVQQGHVNVIQDSQEKEIEYLKARLKDKEDMIELLKEQLREIKR